MSEHLTDDRRRRVQKLKRIIILLLIVSILLPIVLCVILFVRMQSLQKQIEELHELVLQRDTQQIVEVNGEWQDTILSQQPELSNRAETVSNLYDGSSIYTESDEILNDGRRIYLTFDDGPSCYTDDILDILKQYDVKATFFVVGKTDEESLKAYQRIVDEGHTLGTHSYSHKYNEIYKSVDAYAADLRKLQELIYDTTGIWSRYTRFPGGSSNTVSTVDMQLLMEYLEEQGIVYYDWNVSSGDAQSGYISVQTIEDNVMRNIEKHDTAIVLMHDAADKKTTVEALPIIIERILELPDTSLLAIDDETVPVQHIEITE